MTFEDGEVLVWTGTVGRCWQLPSTRPGARACLTRLHSRTWPRKFSPRTTTKAP